MANESALVTNDDMDRLVHLVRTLGQSPFRDQQQLELLDEVLENAEATASEHVPIDVITMNSHFRVLDLGSGKRVRVYAGVPGERERLQRSNLHSGADRDRGSRTQTRRCRGGEGS